MYLFSIMLLCQFSLGLPTDTVIQIRQWGVVGGERVLEQVLVNGVNLTNRNDEINKIIRTILGDAPTRRQAFDLHTEVSEAAMSKNHTLLRVRECIVDGSSLSVQLSDRILCNGKVYLTLDRTTDTWSPQWLAPKRLRDKNPVSTGNERGQLQEGCIHLMQELKLSQAKSAVTQTLIWTRTPSTILDNTPILHTETQVFAHFCPVEFTNTLSIQSGVSGLPVPAVLTPVLALIVSILLVIISLLISKKYGFRHPGGVIGSIIHYPQNITEIPQERKDNGYQAI